MAILIARQNLGDPIYVEDGLTYGAGGQIDHRERIQLDDSWLRDLLKLPQQAALGRLETGPGVPRHQPHHLGWNPLCCQKLRTVQRVKPAHCKFWGVAHIV